MPEDGHNNGAYQLITPPNLLKVKVGGGGGPDTGIDIDAIRLASTAIEGMAEDFQERVTLEVTMIMKLSHDLDSDPSRASKIGSKLARIGFEISGQGETFGFELISEVGTSMCRYINELGKPESLKGDVIRAHADAMRAIIKNRVKGDGGVVGTELVASLDNLVDRMISD